MCIIANEVKEVSHTKIMVATNAARTHQVTVYSNMVNSVTSENAMILPVPYPSSVRFADLSKYTTVFGDCQKDFFNARQTLSRSMSYGVKSQNSNDSLAIFDVGSYSVSLANNVADLDRINESFQITEECLQFMKSRYTAAFWGFIICKLKSGAHEYHPFGYSHALLNKIFFIPTLHYHVHNNSSFPYMGASDLSGLAAPWESDHMSAHLGYKKSNPARLPASGPSESGMSDDWGHDIYVYNGEPCEFGSCEMTWGGSCSVNSAKLQFPLAPCKQAQQLKLHGVHPNRDIFIKVSA